MLSVVGFGELEPTLLNISGEGEVKLWFHSKISALNFDNFSGVSAD
jgi:hypothetical protein